MPEVRERKKSDKIKGKDGGNGGFAKKDVRRQMTVKLQKEMMERKQARDTGGATDQTPEVQAAEQVEEKIYTTADRLREHTGDAVSKSIARYKRKQEKKARSGQQEPSTGETPPADGEGQPPPAREPIRERAAGDMRTRPAESSRQTDIAHERPAAPRSGSERTETPPSSPKERMRQTAIREKRQTIRTQQPTKAIRPQPPAAPGGRPGPVQPELPQGRTAAAPPSPKERMRQNAVKGAKKERERRMEIRRRPADPGGRQTPSPAREPPAPDHRPPQTQPEPQKRMRQKAKAEVQARRNGTGCIPGTPRLERPPAPTHSAGITPASPGNQSIHPIKERSRRSFVPKEKPAGGAFIPKTRQSAAAVKSTARAAPTALKGKRAARPLERMRQRIQRNAQRKLLRQSSQTAKAAVDLSRKATLAIGKAASSMISALVGLVGGAVMIPVFCLIIFVAAILASPFGILFANEPTPDAVPLNVAVGNLNMELSNTLESLQNGDYDGIDIQGQGPDWREVVAVFAVKTAGADSGVDVAALTPDRVDRLRAVFWDMCTVTSEVETIDHPDSDPDDDTDDSWTERILHITVTAKTAEDMRTEYAFTARQNEALTELLAELATVDILLTDLSAIEEQARELLRNLPDDLSPERRAVVETACRLVGKVNYFWGGKSLVIGWDSRWGTIQQVWAAGSPSTGTYRPYGMDCSGFVDWVFYNMSGGSYVIGHGGGARMQHSYCVPITWAEAQPGDLVFYPEDTHVGIVGGWDADGNIQIIHCASGQNNVVITGQAGFTTIGRPIYYCE